MQILRTVIRSRSSCSFGLFFDQNSDGLRSSRRLQLILDLAWYQAQKRKKPHRGPQQLVDRRIRAPFADLAGQRFTRASEGGRPPGHLLHLPQLADAFPYHPLGLRYGWGCGPCWGSVTASGRAGPPRPSTPTTREPSSSTSSTATQPARVARCRHVGSRQEEPRGREDRASMSRILEGFPPA